MWADGFPDGRVKIDKVTEAGNRVVVQFTGSGTHTGPSRARAQIPATGRSITLQLCDALGV